MQPGVTKAPVRRYKIVQFNLRIEYAQFFVYHVDIIRKNSEQNRSHNTTVTDESITISPPKTIDTATTSLQ